MSFPVSLLMLDIVMAVPVVVLQWRWPLGWGVACKRENLLYKIEQVM